MSSFKIPLSPSRRGVLRAGLALGALGTVPNAWADEAPPIGIDPAILAAVTDGGKQEQSGYQSTPAADATG